MNYYFNNDYLIHYGVLGMKWGQRRARIASEKASKYSSKGKTSKAAKYSEKATRISSKHKRLGGTAAYNRVKNTSTGKAIVQSSLMSTYGALKYNEARGKGASRGKALVKGIIYGNVNRATAGLLSVVEPRLDKKKIKNKANKAANAGLKEVKAFKKDIKSDSEKFKNKAQKLKKTLTS